jgi:hypothetical protein
MAHLSRYAGAPAGGGIFINDYSFLLRDNFGKTGILNVNDIQFENLNLFFKTNVKYYRGILRIIPHKEVV